MYSHISPEDEIRVSGNITLNVDITIDLDCNIIPEDKYDRRQILEEYADEVISGILANHGLEYKINKVECD